MSIFKECDIRGIVPDELNASNAYAIGRACGSLIGARTVAVCGDVRISTPELKEQLINGLLESGAQVIDIGIEPTPVFYFAKKILNAYAGIMVTASHNPPRYNGFKIMFGDLPVLPEDILRLKEIIENGAYLEGEEGALKNENVEEAYLQFLKRSLEGGSLRVVLDCGDGTTSKLAPRAFSQMGYDVVKLYCDTDGTFPNRDPNPAVPEHLADLCAKVVECGADMGAAFDGDGDRVVFADNKGKVLMSEQAYVLFLREALKRRDSSAVYDLKSSLIVKSEIEKAGGEPIMERSGHAFIKRTFLNNDAVMGGEISGHFFFGELGYDDGIYAALKLAHLVCASDKTLHELKNTIQTTVITKDIRIPVPYEERDAALDAARAFGKPYQVTETDGVRIDFGDGWALLRKSVTEQAVTLRIEAKDKARVAQIAEMLKNAVPALANAIDPAAIL